MAASVVQDPSDGGIELSVATEGPETDFKPYPPKPWFKKKRLILGSVIIGIFLTVGIVLLVHFTTKDSTTSKGSILILPQFEGRLLHLSIKS